MAHDLRLLALDALTADGPRGVTYQHAFLCHAGDCEACTDGCDAHVDPERMLALEYAADVLMPLASADPFVNGIDPDGDMPHAFSPAWYVQRTMEWHGY